MEIKFSPMLRIDLQIKEFLTSAGRHCYLCGCWDIQ